MGVELVIHVCLDNGIANWKNKLQCITGDIRLHLILLSHCLCFGNGQDGIKQFRKHNGLRNYWWGFVYQYGDTHEFFEHNND